MNGRLAWAQQPRCTSPWILASPIDLVVAIAHQGRARAQARVQRLGLRCTAPRRVVEQPHRWPGAVDLSPHVALGLRLAPGLLENLHRGLVAVDQVALEQVIAQQVDDRLHRLPDAHDAGRERVARKLPAKAPQERGLAVQRHAELVLARDDPGLCGFAEQPARDDACGCRRDLQALAAAGTGVLDALVLDDPDLFGDDVELLADLGSDLHQSVAVVCADALGFGQLVANDVPRQCIVQRLSTPLLAMVLCHGCDDRRILLVIHLGRACLGCCRYRQPQPLERIDVPVRQDEYTLANVGTSKLRYMVN